jgi:uncharacterized damage-inducible protein DinB
MSIHDDLSALYTYNRWADGRVIEAARRLSSERYVQEPAPGWSSVRASIVHLGDALDIWSRRLQGETVTVRTLEDAIPTLDDAERFLRAGHDAFDHLVAALTAERLAAPWSYHNIAGTLMRAPLWAVYRHVVNHATYHRGQVASKLARLGVEPPVTDLVYWAIEQMPAEE